MNGGFMNQVIPLELSTFKDILTGFAVTEKADGERYFVYIDNVGDCYQIAKSKEVIKLEIKSNIKNSLVDTEYMPQSGIYFIFDVLIYEGKDVSALHLKERVKNIPKFIKSNNKVTFKQKVQHFPSNEKTIFELSKEVFRAKYPYKLDGLIYTSIDKGYFSRVYKWKPKEMNTVDFLFRKSPFDDNTFYLFVSITKSFYKMRRFKLNKVYYKLFPEYAHKIKKNKLKFFPYFYRTNDIKDKIDLWDLSDEEKNLVKDNTIIECRLDLEKKTWIPERVRDDKTEIYLKTKDTGEDFRGPNSYRIADSTVKLVVNPITEKMLFEGEFNNKLVNYYQKGINSNRLKVVRKFHNYVKGYLYKKYVHGGSMMEIAGGRGGDLFKLQQRGVKFLLLTDLSEDALEEAKRRVKKIKRMKVKFMQGDFGNNLVNKLRNELRPQEQVDIVAIQFAFHYFLRNKDSLKNIYENVNTFLKKGGYFIFTTFDGKEIFNKLKNKEQLNIKKNNIDIVKIKKKYKNNKLQNLGQEVDVYVESIGEHPEYLVNYSYIIKYWEERDYKVIESELFSTKFKEYKGLDKEDMEFSGLNRYTVMKKN